LQHVGFKTVAYHNYVPSFGEWGYIMAMHPPTQTTYNHLPSIMKYLNPVVLRQMLIFPEDMKTHEVLKVNQLNNQALVNYFEEEWNKYLDR
jgi:spermidine synthase